LCSLFRFPDFQDMYVVARQIQADYLFDEAREVGLETTPHSVWVGRLRFDIIRWQTARLAPRKYCERIVVLQAMAKPPAEQDRMEMLFPNFHLGPNGRVVVAAPRNAEEEQLWLEAYGAPYDGPR
jgi:hypothetical protein